MSRRHRVAPVCRGLPNKITRDALARQKHPTPNGINSAQYGRIILSFSQTQKET
jgi:hypothetical protein